MSLRVSGVSIRRLQLDLRALSVDADMGDTFARRAETEIQRATIDRRLAEVDIQLATTEARELRAVANRVRTEHNRLFSEVFDHEPEYRRLISAQHDPVEAGRYFRAALQDIVDARASLNRLAENNERLSEETERLTNQAIENERMVEELRRTEPNDPEAIRLAGQAEKARLTAEYNRYQCQIFAKQSDQCRDIAVEAAQTLVEVSNANPENPPYLNSTQAATHSAAIHTARQVLACDRVDYSILRGDELAYAERRHHQSFHMFADMAEASLAEIPYPQGSPGEVRTNAELDEFLRELPHPSIRDLQPENRVCPICQEPYGMDGPQGGPQNHPQGSVSISGSVVEYPVKLPCHVFGSECLKTWLTPSKNESCPLCRRNISEG